MTVSNTEKKIALLAANGFDENHMTAIQRHLTQASMTYRVVAPEQGLVNGWQDQSWGHYFTVDLSIGSAMGSDFDALIVVGGERATAKLKQNAHARRIINHFVEAKKPIAAIGTGVALLALSDAIANRTIASDVSSQEDLKLAKAIISPEAQEQDGMILTSTGTDIEGWVNAVASLINSYEVPMEEAA